jgi:phage-related protein
MERSDIPIGEEGGSFINGIAKGVSQAAGKVANMAQGAAQAAGEEIQPAVQGIKQGLTSVGSKISSALGTGAEDAVGDGVLAAAPELGPLAPIAAVIGGLVTLGTSIAQSQHKAPVDTTPMAQSIGVNMSRNHPDPNSQTTIY